MQQNKGNDVDQTGTQTVLTASPMFLQNKSKPKMVKPKKNLKLVFEKPLNLKAVSIKEKS
jgi:hypothetical protein